MSAKDCRGYEWRSARRAGDRVGATVRAGRGRPDTEVPR